MAKIIKTEEIGEIEEFEAQSDCDNTPIDEVIAFFIKAKKQGATHISWNAKADCDGDSLDCVAIPIKEYYEEE